MKLHSFSGASKALCAWAALCFAGLASGDARAGVPQSIPAVEIGIKATNAPAFALPGTASSGLPVTWDVLAGPATVSGTTASVTGSAGAVTLRGRQAGDSAFDSAPDRYLTFLVSDGGGYLSVAAGQAHAAGIKEDGTLWLWGRNDEGQLGDGTLISRSAPQRVVTAGTMTWTHVACGSRHTVARRSDGTLWAWGSNSDGQLGLGSTVGALYPAQVGTASNWAGISCGFSHTSGRKADGSLWMWGDNSQGQLGDGTIGDRLSPVPIGTALDWVEVVCGAQHTCGRRAGGSLWAWGGNTYGQLGDGTTTRRLAPKRIGLDSDWAGLGAGLYFSIGRRTNGTLWTWGNNTSGQLGNGTRTTGLAPAQVGTVTNWNSAQCGADCVVAGRADGSTWAWGDNSAGQHGNGTIIDSDVPVVSIYGPWSSVAVGAASALAVRQGVLWTWGTNDDGQLAVPPEVTGFSAVPPTPRSPLRSVQSVTPLPLLAARSAILHPSATSGLPAVMQVVSGPAVVSADGRSLSFIAEGAAVVALSHPGDGAWEAAPSQYFTVFADGTGPVFTTAPADTVVQLAAPAGTVVNFDPVAVDAQTGTRPVSCVPASGSTFPGGVTVVTCTSDDGLGNITTHLFSVKVNRRPVAIPVTAAALQPSISFTLSATDADEDPVSLSVIAPPANGTLSGTLPGLTFTPNAGFAGTTSFSYKASDGTVDSLPALVTLQVLNSAPVADGQSLATSAASPLPVTLTGSDVNGQSLAFSIVTPPGQGTLSGAAPNVVYTPTPGTAGPESFTFRVFDGMDFSAPATILILVNDPPVVPARNGVTNEDTAMPILLTGVDPNSQSLAFSVVTPPAHGTLSGSGASLSYMPAADYVGPDSFTYQAGDGYVNSAPGTFTITVQAVNDAPVAQPQSVTTDEDTATAITLAGSDAESSPLTYALTAGPAHGSLSGTAPNLVYTPAGNYNGPDEFSFTVSDGLLTSSAATVLVTVGAVNDAPVAQPQSVTTDEDTAVSVNLAGSDVESSPLTFAIAAAPAHGSLSGTAPNLVYTPDGNYNGPDEFSFTVSDGLLTSSAATVLITVSAVNDAPVAQPQSVTTDEDTATAITLAGADAEMSPLTYALTAGPAHGTLSGTAPDLVYTPSGNYSGPDQLSFTVSDGSLTSIAATVLIAVSAVNDAPVAVAVAVTSVPPLSFVMSGTDVENSALTFAIVTPPASGTLSGTPPNLVFQPAPGFLGSISFTYKASDGAADSVPAAITLNVLNAQPVVAPRAITTPEDEVVQIVLAGTDANDQPLTFTIVTPPAHGTLAGTSPNFAYTPAENWNGADSFVYKVSDGLVDSAPATVALTVTPVNDPPATSFELFSVAEDATLTVGSSKRVLLNDSDFHEGALGENNSPLAAIVAVPPAHAASFTLNPDGTFTYQPVPNYYGIDSFTYRAVDSLGAASDPETVLISVMAVNDAPVGAPQAVRTLEDVPVPIHLRSADVDVLAFYDPAVWLTLPPFNPGPAPHDADPTYTIASPPVHGTLTGSIPNLIYTPAANYHGTDSFTFRVNDGLAISAPATVGITILADSDGDLLPDAWEIQSFSTLAYTGNSDPDGDGQSNAFELIAGNDPANANSCLCMEPASPSPTGGVFRLNRVQPGVLYSLETSSDFVHWDTVGSSTYEINGPGAVYDPRIDSPGRRFYRVSVAPQ